MFKRILDFASVSLCETLICLLHSTPTRLGLSRPQIRPEDSSTFQEQYEDHAWRTDGAQNMDEFHNIRVITSRVLHEGLARRLSLCLRNISHPRKPALGVDTIKPTVSQRCASVELEPDGRSRKPRWFTNLGGSLSKCFERTRKLEGINGAIATQRRAIKLMPDEHPDKPNLFDNLGRPLSGRFEQTEKPKGIEDSVALQSRAVDLTPDDHPEEPPRLSGPTSPIRAIREAMRNESVTPSMLQDPKRQVAIGRKEGTTF